MESDWWSSSSLTAVIKRRREGGGSKGESKTAKKSQMNFLILDNFRIIKMAVSFQSISSLTGSIVLHDFQYSSEVFACREKHSGTNATSLL